MKNLITLGTCLIMLIATACNNFPSTESCTTPAPLNPNGDSELALLMREMFDDGMRIKEQIEKGEKPEFLKKFEAIHTAEATQPEKANSKEFKLFADSYLATLKALQNAKPEELEGTYHGVVQSCMNCHQAMCPGPMVRIKKLYLPEDSD